MRKVTETARESERMRLRRGGYKRGGKMQMAGESWWKMRDERKNRHLRRRMREREAERGKYMPWK